MNKFTCFVIRPYKKRELARLYFPMTRNVDSAVRNFYNLMQHNRELMRQLTLTGYTPHTKILTARQVRIIVKFLEEP